MGFTYYENREDSRGLKNILKFICRILISSAFLIPGMLQLIYWDELKSWLPGYWISEYFYIVGLFFKILGSVMTFFGFKTRLGALLLIIYLLPSAVVYHQFWNFDNTNVQVDQLLLFFNDIGLSGGLFFLIISRISPFSIDNLIRKKREST